jgi:hypothetical protein
MYILSQATPLENSDNKIYRVQIVDLEKEYYATGYQRHERIYKIKYQYKEYSIICPEYRSINKSDETIVIIPEFLIPMRPYPVYVYLYAIDMYSSNPELGQRKVSEMTRKKFGLSHFAHTTLGRALKAFVSIIEESEKTSERSCDENMSENGKEGDVHNLSTVESDLLENDSRIQRSFPTRRSTHVLCNQASKFLRGDIVRVARQQAIKLCYDLVRRWFIEYRRLLL